MSATHCSPEVLLPLVKRVERYYAVRLSKAGTAVDVVQTPEGWLRTSTAARDMILYGECVQEFSHEGRIRSQESPQRGCRSPLSA